jgi:hypothetical protein
LEDFNRTQFTFYDSFYRAVSRIKKKADRADAYDAIVAYALYGIEPDMDTMPDAAAIAFEVAKPNLDASRRKAANGKQGGKASKHTESKPEANASKSEANGKQTESKQEARRETENSESKYKDKNKNKIKNKHKCVYGEYANVLLTEEELQKLQAEFPSHWQKLIDRLSGYMQSKGVKYTDHLATMRNWGRKDNLNTQPGSVSTAPVMGSLEQEAIRRMLGQEVE